MVKGAGLLVIGGVENSGRKTRFENFRVVAFPSNK
jgi:hypothetical protein